MADRWIALISGATGFSAGAFAMWLRSRLRNRVASDRADLIEHLRKHGGRNVVGGPRWKGWPDSHG